LHGAYSVGVQRAPLELLTPMLTAPPTFTQVSLPLTFMNPGP
jgi:hypothetical protein